MTVRQARRKAPPAVTIRIWVTSFAVAAFFYMPFFLITWRYRLGLAEIPLVCAWCAVVRRIRLP